MKEHMPPLIRTGLSMALLAVALIAAPTGPWAQMRQLSASATTADFIRALTPAPGKPTPPRARDVVIGGSVQPDQDSGAGMAEVSIHIKFGTNTATLTGEGEDVIKRLAAALNSPQLLPYHFLIHCFTARTHDADRALELTNRQADAVRTLLVGTYGIDPTRIDAMGEGQSTPLDKAHPESAVNERIEVVNLGP
jgi:outer membrane protein OmpA-like peptidoglycan-associated protein